MSPSKEIGAPFTLATLPQSLKSSSDRVHAASVCSISGTKKRKRTEIVIGVHGEGISIYSLQDPRLVASYALPPQVSIASDPYSVYRKGTSKRPPRRYTYASVVEDTPGAKPQLVCFIEETRKDTTKDIAKTSYTPSDTSRSVISIDSIPIPAGGSQRDASHDVLVSFDNGDVICLSSDLDVVRWVTNLYSMISSRGHVEHVSLSTARAVTQGLLRSRNDITAVLNPSSEDTTDLLDLTQVICVVSRQSGSERLLGLFQVKPRFPNLPASQLVPVQHLLTWHLSFPQSTTTTSHIPRYSLHANSGTLHVLNENTLLSYEFSGTAPKSYSNVDISTLKTDSFVRISQDLLLTTSRDHCRMLDVKYESVHAEISLSSKTSNGESNKRKHIDPIGVVNPKSAPALIAYYADLGLAVAFRDNEVVGFQLEEITARKRVKTQGTRLIDSLGKGLPFGAKIPGSLGDDANDDLQKWQEKKAKLDKYASKGKIAKFEKVIASDLHIELDNGPGNNNELNNDQPDHRAHSTVLTNGVTTSTLSPHQMTKSKINDEDKDLPLKWRFPKSIPGASNLRYRRYASYALSRIFRWVNSPSTQGPQGYLKIDFFPPNVFQWLIQSGQLTKESIRRAVADDTSQILGTTTPIRDGDIVQAIMDFDPELHVLSALLHHTQFLPIGEIVQATKLLMQSLDDGQRAETSNRMLTNGTEPAVDAMDIDFASELEAASHEIDWALSILDNGLAVRNNTLRTAFIKLHTFPTSVISTTLRSMLSRHDLESLVRLLHHEFKKGGWMLEYVCAYPEESQFENSEDTDNSAAAIIASLLSCTLDAMGPITWVTGVDGDDETKEQLIADLFEDTDEALNAFWETVYIQGLVSELLRYASKLPKSQKPNSKTLEKQGKPVTRDLNPEELPMLPLGAKPDMGIEKTKTKGGKKKERSAREMGMLISQRVPKYSFERIVI